MRSSLSDPVPPPDPLPHEIAAAFDRSRDRLRPLASRVLYFDSIGSTNDVASSLAGDGEGLVIVANAQTAGRGRLGRTWVSPPGSGLYVSVVLAPARARVDARRAASLITIAAGVALAEAVEAATKLRVDIKWPNDLYVGRRKLAGILGEAVADAEAPDAVPSVVLGYGINVAATAYPPEVANRATSLETELGRPIDRADLLVETLAQLARRYGDLLDGRFDVILDAWRASSPHSQDARVSWTSNSGLLAGITCGIDDDGALLVRVAEHVERIVGGEVMWL